MYVIICHGNGKFDGAYVADSSTGASYTHDLKKAKRFAYHTTANKDKCGNESVESVESQLSGS